MGGRRSTVRFRNGAPAQRDFSNYASQGQVTNPGTTSCGCTLADAGHDTVDRGAGALACGNQTECDGIRPNRRSSSLRSVGYAWIRPRAVSVAGRSASVSSAVSAVGSWSPFLHSIKASIISSTPLSRSGRPGVRIESVRALTAQTVLRARAGSRRSCRTRCCGSGT
jgi:hypothetical protein